MYNSWILSFFFRFQRQDEIGKCAVKVQLAVLFKMILIILILCLFYQHLPWYILISFSLDCFNSLLGFLASVKRISILLFVFFLISLLLFLFNFIPLVLINSIVWNENPVIKSKDIFQSICHVFWFATEILSMHFSRRQRIIIKEEKIQRQHEKELNNESISTAPSLIICVEGYQHDGFENNNNNTDNNCNSNNSENHTTIDIVPTTTNNSKFNDNFNNDDLIKQAYLITPIPITSIPIITTNNAIQ